MVCDGPTKKQHIIRYVAQMKRLKCVCASQNINTNLDQPTNVPRPLFLALVMSFFWKPETNNKTISPINTHAMLLDVLQ